MSHDVGSIEQFPGKRMSVVRVRRTEIGIPRWSGAIYAISNVCIHQGGALCQGVLASRLAARRPGEMSVDDMVPTIACVRHSREFDVASGHAICEPTTEIRTFPVCVTNGQVLVETGEIA
jgi:nitrite reductase/ring-hydroxylating ferredoxin subunit